MNARAAANRAAAAIKKKKWVAGCATHFFLDALRGPPGPAANQRQGAVAHDSALAFFGACAMREL